MPGGDRFGPAGCQGINSPRGILSSHNHMSPESVRLMHRHRSAIFTVLLEYQLFLLVGRSVSRPRAFSLSHSPLNLQGSIRHSSSSLSSHTSSEAGNLVIMTDGLMGEHPEEALHMQVRGSGGHSRVPLENLPHRKTFRFAAEPFLVEPELHPLQLFSDY